MSFPVELYYELAVAALVARASLFFEFAGLLVDGLEAKLME